MRKHDTAYILPEPMELSTLLAGLPDNYSVQNMGVSVDTICYLDTFDWRLHDKKIICQRHGKNIYVLTDFAGEYRIQAEGPAQKKVFPLDFPCDPLGEKLVAVAGIRALLPFAEITRHSQFFEIMNRDQKKILSGSLESNQLLKPGDIKSKPINLEGVLRLHGVRGYDKILFVISELLQMQGIQQGCPEERVLRLALFAQGKKPQDYSSHFSIILDPAESIVHAAQKIFLHLFKEMERNVPGVVEDIDTEFLHDFRVALRRTRSLLGSMKKIGRPEDIACFQQGFRKIGLITGPVRDLDVYLLEKKVYHSMLPEGLQEGLAVFFQGLTRQRAKELQRLKKAMQSSDFQAFMVQWREYIEHSFLSSALDAGQEPCREVAIKAIRKRLRSILKNGALIGPLSPDTELHCLRIQAKKLRYLLEFYRSLFPEAEMEILVKSLKKLQDNLGNFNDLSVQQKMLGQYQSELTIKDQKNAIKVAAALGGLITHLHEEQTAVRGNFEQTFEQFTSIENTRLFEMLFSTD
jgi:CHAD domain-containing protein